MKRSQINAELEAAEEFFARYNFQLPSFGHWSPEELRSAAGDPAYREIFDCFLGWDITDFGRGDFRKEGLLLFTIRNGKPGDPRYRKPYAEKIMIVREEQLTLMHCHIHKTEDIINRGGGNLHFQLYLRRGETGELNLTDPIEVHTDGRLVRVPPGGTITLAPGESLTLEPGVFHAFKAERGSGDVLVGEVSAVNDDHCDNVYHGVQLRFPEIEEDAPLRRLLVKDYESLRTSECR